MFMRTFLSFLFLSKVEKSIKSLNNLDDLTVSKRAGTRYGIKIHFLFFNHVLLYILFLRNLLKFRNHDQYQ